MGGGVINLVVFFFLRRGSFLFWRGSVWCLLRGYGFCLGCDFY